MSAISDLDVWGWGWWRRHGRRLAWEQREGGEDARAAHASPNPLSQRAGHKGTRLHYLFQAFFSAMWIHNLSAPVKLCYVRFDCCKATVSSGLTPSVSPVGCTSCSGFIVFSLVFTSIGSWKKKKQPLLFIFFFKMSHLNAFKVTISLLVSLK